MPKCKIKECPNSTPYKNSKNPYCSMHMARFRRNGHFDVKTGSHGLEKLPHEVDKFILENCKNKDDYWITRDLIKLGYKGATPWTVKYRRRRLGIRKYEYGEVKKHKAWIRAQAIRTYGNSCELCNYNMSVETHHIVPKYKGGPHEIENLTVVCPNCHSLITRGKLVLHNRRDIPQTRKRVLRNLKKFYDFL